MIKEKRKGLRVGSVKKNASESTNMARETVTARISCINNCKSGLYAMTEKENFLHHTSCRLAIVKRAG